MIVSIKKILSLLYNISILIGLSWQVYEVSSLFFKFDVLTHLDIDFDEIIVTPDMSLCITYYDILNISAFNQITGSDLDPNASQGWRRLQNNEVQSKITISQLFSSTPQEGSTIASCLLRHPNIYTMDYANGESCFTHFQVEKYSFMDSICYRLSHAIGNETNIYSNDRNIDRDIDTNTDTNIGKNLIYTKRDIVFSPDDPGIIFYIRLSSDLNGSNGIRIMMHPVRTFPWIEAAYSSESFRSVNEVTNEAEFNYFSVTSSRITTKKLPPPYTSNCRNYANEGLENVYHCRQWCYRNKTLHRFDKIPFSSRITSAIDKRRICANDYDNRTIRVELMRFQKECNHACAQDDCDSIITSTDVETSQYNSFTLAYKTPIKPSLELSFGVKQSLTEFLVYVTSCFGIWLGVSAYHSNPFNKLWSRKIFSLISTHQVEGRDKRRDKHVEERMDRKSADLITELISNRRQMESFTRMITMKVYRMLYVSMNDQVRRPRAVIYDRGRRLN